MAEERWLPVVGFEKRYAVSSFGRVKSLKTGKIRKPKSAGCGYLAVGLSIERKVFNRYVHRLVLEAFVGRQPNLEANHIDAVKTNNRLTNLEWCTRSENMAHAVRLGLVASGDRASARKHPESVPRNDRHYMRLHPEKIPRGEDRPQTNLVTADILEIRRLSASGIANKEIAKRFGVGRHCIFQIVTRRRWGHVE
jgi:hypothetical protein